MKVFGIAGWSGSGKTTLIESLVPLLVARGLKVSLIKRAHHEFEVDQPGKDSYRHRQAGCMEVMLSSSARYALMHELRSESEMTLPELVARMSPCDLLLVEGFKREPIPKFEVWRSAVGKPALYPDDPHVVGLATDAVVASGLPQFALDDYAGIAAFICGHDGLQGLDS